MAKQWKFPSFENFGFLIANSLDCVIWSFHIGSVNYIGAYLFFRIVFFIYLLIIKNNNVNQVGVVLSLILTSLRVGNDNLILGRDQSPVECLQGTVFPSIIACLYGVVLNLITGINLPFLFPVIYDNRINWRVNIKYLRRKWNAVRGPLMYFLRLAYIIYNFVLLFLRRNS